MALKQVLPMLLAVFGVAAALQLSPHPRHTYPFPSPSSSDPSPQPVNNINGFFDMMLKKVIAYFLENGYDNYDLPYYNWNVTFEVWGYNVSALLELHDGHLRGLETLLRDGNATLNSTTKDLYAPMKIAPVQADYQMNVSFWGYVYNFTAIADVKHFKFDLEGHYDDEEKKPIVDAFTIREIGKIDLEVHGLPSILQVLLEQMTETVANLLRNEVGWLFEGKILELLQSIIDSGEVPFPQ